MVAAKDGLGKLPHSVHKTVDDVMKFFKNSKEKLEVIIQLVTYHKVRWLSLNDCVKRFTDLLPEIVLYFEQEAHNTSLQPGERSNMREFYDELVHPEFQLYLSGRLPILASISYKHLSKTFLLLTKGFSRTFFEPILRNVESGM